ncbi:MAG: hypothetical protein P8X55_07035 [Desulfosarcinaceae bacterium]
MTRDDIRGYRLVAIFLLGFALFNYPLLSLFNLPRRIGGIPMLYAYLFMVWLLLILLTMLATRSRKASIDDLEIDGD